MTQHPIRDRLRRLRNLKAAPPGNVWMAKCRCGHLAPLPVASLIEKHGELFPLDRALSRLRCSLCGHSATAEARLLRLCDPGCGRHRG